MRKHVLAVGPALGLLCAAIGGSAANPIISFSGSQQFQAGINNGSITGFTPGGNPFDQAAMDRTYPSSTSQQRKTTIDTVTTPADGLNAKLGSVADLNAQIVGGYTFHYIADPDLNGIGFLLDIYVPQVSILGSSGIDTIGIAITDSALKAKAWTFDNTTFAVGTNEFKFNFSDGAGAGGSTGFGEDAGFSLSTAQLIQVNQRGVLGPTFPLTPDNGDFAAWTITTRLQTTSEPSAVALLFTCALASGILGLYRWAR